MRTIHLTRNNKNGKAVHGTMRVGERDIETLENADYIIPDGTYTVSVTYSPLFKKMMPLISTVPGRSGIRIQAEPSPNIRQGACSSVIRKTARKSRSLLTKTKQEMKKLLFVLVVAVSVGVGMTSCKAWRTISTSATYTQVGDSTKTTTTITTKTVEEYQGVKKN